VDKVTLGALILFGGGIGLALIAYYIFIKNEKKHKHS
jgi:hypothetical protein